MNIQSQPWQPPLETVEIPQKYVRLAFPKNHFSATIIGDHIQLSISTDMESLPAVIERLNALMAVVALGPMPQPKAWLNFPREAVAGDFMLCESGDNLASTLASGPMDGGKP